MNVFCQVFQSQGFPIVPIFLPVILQHPDHMQAFLRHPLDKRLVGEPGVHEDILRRDSSVQGFPNQGDGGVGLMQNRFLRELPGMELLVMYMLMPVLRLQ